MLAVSMAAKQQQPILLRMSLAVLCAVHSSSMKPRAASPINGHRMRRRRASGIRSGRVDRPAERAALKAAPMILTGGEPQRPARNALGDAAIGTFLAPHFIRLRAHSI